MTTQAARFIGNIPENYDRSLGPCIFEDYAQDLARRSADLNPEKVLELAAGTGILTRRLRESLPSTCYIIASDLNMPMLEVAKVKFHPDELVQFSQIDATNIELDDGSVDQVVCQFGVMFFPDKHRSYSEVYRVLKAEGRYLFNVWGSWENNPFAKITHDVVKEFFPDDPPGFYKVPFGYHDTDAIRESVLQAGFTQVEIESVEITSDIPSASEFAKGLVFGNPLHEEIETREGDPQQICEAVAVAIDQQLGASMPLQAIVIHASKA